MAVLSAEDFAQTGAEDNYAEGIVDHLRAVSGTKVAALIREIRSGGRCGEWKVSLRASESPRESRLGENGALAPAYPNQSGTGSTSSARSAEENGYAPSSSTNRAATGLRWIYATQAS